MLWRVCRSPKEGIVRMRRLRSVLRDYRTRREDMSQEGKRRDLEAGLQRNKSQNALCLAKEMSMRCVWADVAKRSRPRMMGMSTVSSTQSPIA